MGPLSSSTASRTPGPSSGKWAKHAFPAPVLVVYFPSLVHPTFPQDPQREISGQAPRLLRAERAASLYLSAAADRPERHQRVRSSETDTGSQCPAASLPPFGKESAGSINAGGTSTRSPSRVLRSPSPRAASLVSRAGAHPDAVRVSRRQNLGPLSLCPTPDRCHEMG